MAKAAPPPKGDNLKLSIAQSTDKKGSPAAANAITPTEITPWKLDKPPAQH